MNIKLSFIIPVYNSVEFIEECINSIVVQFSKCCEIVLIDDGSFDGSELICDQFAHLYQNISVTHIDNSGPSNAREKGLQLAKGEYICFVDSDDRIAQNSIPQILEWIEKDGADICFMQAEKFYPNGKSKALGDDILPEAIRGRSQLEVLSHLATRPKYPGSPCTKIFRKSFLIQNNIAFPSDKRYAEDLGYVLEALLKANSYDALSFPYYEYRQENQYSRSNNLKKSIEGMMIFISDSIQQLSDKKRPQNKTSQYALSFVAYEYSIVLWQYSQLDDIDRSHIFQFLNTYQWVLKYGIFSKGKTIYFLTKVLGLERASKLLDIYMIIRRRV